LKTRPEDIEAYQNVWELDQMVAVVERLLPRRVLEIGTMWGGTLWYWLQVAERVVAVDDAMRLASFWEKWADAAASELVLLQGMSQDAELVEKARELGPYDFIFIDADHRYDSVKADWENYREMVALGGVIAFHDTNHPENDIDYGVKQLWEEITSEIDVRWMHIAMTNHCGIGLVWM
jgi:cephalosporin hydroxylase